MSIENKGRVRHRALKTTVGFGIAQRTPKQVSFATYAGVDRQRLAA